METDRRKHTRIDTSFNFGYRIYTRTEIAGDISQIKNISVGGAQILTKHKLNSDNILEINFRTPKSKEKIILFGKVLDCYKIQEKAIYVSRVSFAYPDENTFKIMPGLIEEIKSL